MALLALKSVTYLFVDLPNRDGISKKIKVLVNGTGFAGQGHTDAFRNAGAEVVGIVGRTESVVKEVAQNMGIPYEGTAYASSFRYIPEIMHAKQLVAEG